jgi:glycosyltransferase involved in cell wall biosynthesis
MGRTLPARWAAGAGGTLADVPASMAPPFRKLSIFFPMWNEEQYIDRAIESARTECELLVQHGEVLDYELLIVDDASTDRTPEMADEMAAADPRVRVVHHPVNRKLGGSMKTGFANCTGDLILYSDADLPFDMQEMHKAVRLLRYYDADVVSAFRHDRTTEGAVRAVYTFFYNVGIRRLFGVRMRDINFAFKLCRAEIFEHVTLRSEGSFIDAELIIRARKLGYQVIQFGVDYFPRTRGASTLASLRVIRTIVAEMFQLRRELRSIQPLPSRTVTP